MDKKISVKVCLGTTCFVMGSSNLQELIETVQKYHITIWNSVPAIMDIAIENLSTDFYNDTLRLVMLSGDWIPLQLPVVLPQI